MLLAFSAVAGPSIVARRSVQEDDERDTEWSQRGSSSPKRAMRALPVEAHLELAPLECTAPWLWTTEEAGAALVHLQTSVAEGDRVVVRTMLGAADLSLGEPTELTEQPGEYFAPRGMRSSRGTDLVFWSEVVDGHTRLSSARRGTSAEWSAPRPVPRSEGVLSPPALVADPGVECLVAFDRAPDGEAAGCSVTVVAMNGDEVVAHRVITGAGGSAHEPVLARGAGTTWIAWTEWRRTADGRANADVLAAELRFTEGTVRQSPPLALAWDPVRDEQHPSLVIAADGTLWCAFDSVTDPGKAKSDARGDGRAVVEPGVVAVRDGHFLTVPWPNRDRELPLVFSASGGLPQLVLDEEERPTLFLRYLDEEGGRVALHSYPSVVQAFDGRTWSEPQWFDGSEGAQDPIAACAVGEGFCVAWQEDQRHLNSASRLTLQISEEQSASLHARQQFLTGSIGPSTIGISRYTNSGGERHAPAIAEAAQPAAQLEAPAPREPRFKVLHGERTYRVWFGDLHRHSSVSRCLNGAEPRPEDLYRFAREVCQLDFVAVTDHSGHTDPLQWWQARKAIARESGAQFVALLGYEWSTSRFGHQNVVYRERPERVISPAHPPAKEPTGLWELLADTEALTIPHHTAHTRMATDWSHRDDERLRQVEVFQSARGSYEAAGAFRAARTATAAGHFVRDGLDEGHRFGLIASSDHGSGAAYAAVLAERLDRDAVFDALRARRTYATTTRRLLVDFRVDGALMGSELVVNETPELSLRVHSDVELAEVQVFKNGRPIFGRGQQRGRVVPEESILTLQWWNRPTTPHWRFRIEASEGRFEPVNERNLERERNRWEQESERVITGEEENDGTISSPLKRFRYIGPADAVLSVTVAGTTYQTSVRELVRGPLRAAHQRSRWVLRLVDAGNEVVELAPHGLGAEFEHQFEDRSYRPGQRAWYYARAIRCDGEIGWSSPIFIDPPEGSERPRDDRRGR